MTALKPPGHRGSIVTFVLLLGLQTHSGALARGSFPRDDLSNAGHIDSLPRDVRNSVVNMCGTRPNAGHYFATYLDNARIIKLHFEYLDCEGAQPVHFRDDSCLRQEYSQSGAHYHLTRSYFGRCDD